MARTLASLSSFYEGWVQRHESFLEELSTLSSSFARDGVVMEQQYNDLMDRVLAHYNELQERKLSVMFQDAAVVLSSPWMTCLEKALLWHGGFKPMSVYSLVNKVADMDLTGDQLRRIEMAKEEIRWGEKQVDRRMAKVQESIAIPPAYAAFSRYGMSMDGELPQLDEAIMACLNEKMRRVINEADELRQTAISLLMEVLSPVQTLKFYAAAAQCIINVRKTGLEKDAQGS